MNWFKEYHQNFFGNKIKSISFIVTPFSFLNVIDVSFVLVVVEIQITLGMFKF